LVVKYSRRSELPDARVRFAYPAASTAIPAAFQSRKPSRNLWAAKPRARRAATASTDRTQYGPRQ